MGLSCIQASRVQRGISQRWKIDSTTERLLNNSLLAPRRNNTHHELNALTDGTNLIDNNGALTRLKDNARIIRNSGPNAMSKTKRRNLRLRTAVALSCSDEMFKNANTPLEEEGRVWIRCYTRFYVLFYGYCRAHLIWASSIPDTIRWSSQNCRDLHDPGLGLITASTVREKQLALKPFYKSIFRDLRRDGQQTG
jgi:hypothetical protein